MHLIKKYKITSYWYRLSFLYQHYFLQNFLMQNRLRELQKPMRIVAKPLRQK